MNKAERVTYRIKRRQGHARGPPALTEARAMVRRLTGAAAILEASDFRADPLTLARNANLI